MRQACPAARHQVRLDQLPAGAEAVGGLTWRDLPETEAELNALCTGGFLQSKACPIPPPWSDGRRVAMPDGTPLAGARDAQAKETASPTTRRRAAARTANAST